jgi:glycosyltransferase involved in cell wall biosynthesis
MDTYQQEQIHLKTKFLKLKNNMNSKLSLSVILPIKSSKAKDFDEYFEKAIVSLKNQQVEFEELVIVHTQEQSLVDLLNSYDFGEINVTKLLWDKEPSYANQVNFGIENAKGTWVSLFEFDDEYSSIWFKNVHKYIESFPEVQMFLPVVVETDEKGLFAGFTNEATFAANFSQEMGILTNDTLQEYQNFQTAGSVFKKSIVEDFGGFKPSIKLTFIYEFLLRLTYNSVAIMTIPRLGYKHVNLREGSIFWNYKFSESKMLEDEVKFWIQAAKREYFFTDDRSIKYQSENA